MPRIGQIDPNKYLQVSEKDTYRYSTPDVNPTVKPVDAFANPGGNVAFRDMPSIAIRTPNFNVDTSNIVDAATRDARTLQSILDGVSSTVKVYGDYKREASTHEKKQGYYAAVRGEALSENANENEKFGHDLYSGEASAVKLDAELNEAFATHAQTDKPEEWLERVTTIKNKYMETKSDAYLEGFVPKATSYLASYTGKFNTLQVQKAKEETLNNFTIIFSKEVDDILANNKIPPNAKPALIRQTLTQHQASAKELGLDRNDISERAVQVVGEVAASTGKPGLMEFTKIPDESGVSLANTNLFKTVSAYTREARSKAQSNETHSIALQERAERKAGEAKQAELTAKILAGQDITADLQNPANIKLLKGHALQFDSINRQRQEPDFNIKESPVDTIERSINARLGKYTYADLATDVADRKITTKTAEKLAGEIEGYSKYSASTNKPMQSEFEPYHVGKKQIENNLQPTFPTPFLTNQARTLQEKAKLELGQKVSIEFNDNVSRNNGMFNPDDAIYRQNVEKHTQDILGKYKKNIDSDASSSIATSEKLLSESSSDAKKRFSNMSKEQISSEFMTLPSYEIAFKRFAGLEKSSAFADEATKKYVLGVINQSFKSRGN